MPGKRNLNNASYVTQPTLYRAVAAADADTLAAVAALTDSIDMSYIAGDGGTEYEVIHATDSTLNIGVAAPAAVIGITMKVYVDMQPRAESSPFDELAPALGDERWCLTHEVELTRASLVTIRDVPPTLVRIVLTSITGAGTVNIVCSRST